MVSIREQVKRLMPRLLTPMARKIYRIFSKTAPQTGPLKAGDSQHSALKCRVSYNKYGGYCVPESSQHRPAAQLILSGDVWEPKTIEYIMANCGNGDVVHAGTYFGDFLPAVSKGCSLNSRIWAFEPNPENYRCAKITLEINNISNVVLENAGLGAKKDNLNMRTADKHGRALGGESIIIDNNQADVTGIESIEIVALDDVIGQDREISIIQLDVEGHEKEALTGALMTIQRSRPIIILEDWPRGVLFESDWFSENILSLGYRHVKDIHENAVFRI